MTLIYYKCPRTMTQVNVSTAVGMSPTVGMSMTVGEMSATVGKLKMLEEILEWRLSFITLHKLPLRIHGITCKKTPLGFEK